MTIILTLLGLWALLLGACGTPIGAWLDRALVQTPARMIGRITRGHLLLALALAGVIGLVFLILDHEGLRLMSMAAPEISSFLVTFEVSTWLDVAAAAIVAASTTRVRAVASLAKVRLTGLLRRPRTRARRSRPATPTTRRPANDDDPAPELLRAA